MKVFGLCSSVLYVAVKAKPQNIQQFYSDYFQDNNQDQESQKDNGVVADHYDDYVDYGSGSGDGDFERDVADEFIKRDLK